MPSGNRLQQLVDLGVANSVGDFSNTAKYVINEMTDEEFSSLLSVRDKVFGRGEEPARDEYDHCVTEVV